jgi:hypothetical protein
VKTIGEELQEPGPGTLEAEILWISFPGFSMEGFPYLISICALSTDLAIG